MAELVDAPDLGSGAARRGGSSPFTRTMYSNKTFYIEEADTVEFLQLIFYIPASLILYNATRPEIRDIF